MGDICEERGYSQVTLKELSMNILTCEKFQDGLQITCGLPRDIGRQQECF